MATQQSPSAPPAASSSSPFELRWRLFGIGFKIAPSFWIVSALMGWMAIGDPGASKNLWICLLLWVLCTLVSVLVHEMGHVLMGRIFGQPSDITLAGLGGQAAGKFELLANWQRIFVAAAGPYAGFSFLFLLVMVDSSQWNLVMDWLTEKTLNGFFLHLKAHLFLIKWINPLLPWSPGYYRDVMFYLLIMNLIWNLLNLIPIVPMDGGMILREICCIISPVGGLKFAFGFSFLISALVVAYCLLAITMAPHLPTFVQPHFSILMFGMLAYQNFMLLRQVTAAQRSAHYQERFDD